MVSRITPLTCGIQRLTARKASSFGTAAAKVPAIRRGSTCPIPKLVSSATPTSGLPFWAIQPSNTASTGVVHGDDAIPKAIPAATGASGAGTLFLQLSGLGPEGKGMRTIPNKFRPIMIARTATRFGIRDGS